MKDGNHGNRQMHQSQLKRGFIELCGEALSAALQSHQQTGKRERESRAHRLDDVNFRSILLILKIFKSGGSVTFASSFI